MYDNANVEEIKDLLPESKKAVLNNVFFNVRGKKGCEVQVIMTKDCAKYIELLFEHRLSWSF